jgi:ABC-type Fe3+ transport system permease subunit
MYHLAKGRQVTGWKRSVGVVSKQKAHRVQVMQAATGSLSGLTALVLMLGFAIAWLTTSTRRSTEIVLTSVTIVGALVGGFVLAPFLDGLVSTQDRERQRED